MQGLARDQAPYGWTMYSAMELRIASISAASLAGASTTATTTRMPLLSAQVSASSAGCIYTHACIVTKLASGRGVSLIFSACANRCA